MPPIAYILSGAVIVGHLLTLVAAHTMLEYVALVPAYIGLVRSHPWTVVTFAFVETNPFLAIFNAAVLATAGRELEETRGTRAFVMLHAAALGLAAASFILEGVLLYPLGKMALFQCTYGAMPLALATVVGAWQQNPEGDLFRGVAPTRYVPIAALVYCLAMDYFFAVSPPTEAEISVGTTFPGDIFQPALAGLWAGWVYLRLFDTRTGVAGDPSPVFAFHMMFPMPLRVAVLAISTVLTPIGYCCGFRSTAPAGAAAGATRQADEAPVAIIAKEPLEEIKPLPGTTAGEADRRRQAALDALATRLQSLDQKEDAAVDMDDFDTDVK